MCLATGGEPLTKVGTVGRERSRFLSGDYPPGDGGVWSMEWRQCLG